MVKRSQHRPKGGRSHRGNYKTVTMRVPLPLREEVERLIDDWHRENNQAFSLPLQGHWSEVLGVDIHASADEVRTAYLKLSGRFHPDKNHRRDANERFIAIHTAYKTYSQGLS